MPWAPGDYHNTYRARVEELIEHKREGQAVVFEAERPKSNVIDLMAALEASVANMGPGAAGGTGGTGGTGGSGTRAGGTGGSGTRAGGTRAGGTRADGTRAGIGRPGKREQPVQRTRRGSRGARPGTGHGVRAAGLAALSKADLLARAAELDIAGRSKMSKPELIKAIQAAGRPKRGARKIS